MAEPPAPGPGQVLVRVRAVGVCGSDLHWYLEGRIGPKRAVYPHLLGHEAGAEVVAAGPGVADLKPGDRVAVEPNLPCGVCEPCQAGQVNCCVRSIFMGSSPTPGLLCEYAVVPAQNAVRVPAGMSFECASLVEPLSVILHSFDLAPIRVGDTVAVLGAGPIGLFSAAVARAAGASRVFSADRVSHRLKLALAMGADVVIDTTRESVRDAVLDHTRGRGADLVIDAAAASETINAGLAVTRPAGRFVLIGLPTEENQNLDLHLAMGKEIDILALRRSAHNGHAAIEMLASGRVPTALITHRYPLAATPEAYRTLAEYRDGVGKVIVEV